MPISRQASKAGSIASLPFFFLVGALILHSSIDLWAQEKAVLTFQVFNSSCIDLGRYDRKEKQLTVRFVNRNTERFYRYSNVPAQVWAKLTALNETGGVGEYLNETIVRNPEKFPYEELTIPKFKTVAAKKKAEDSK